jgi:cyclopropane-fatty-acyl-phospholipid synthase
MSVIIDKSAPSTTIYDRILRQIQKHLANRVKTSFEIKLWGDRSYHFGEGAPALEIRVHDRKGLAALGRFDELGICEAYMAGNLDVAGDMLGFVSLRGTLKNSPPLDYLWRRIAPWIIGRVVTNQLTISDQSKKYVLDLIDRLQLPDQVMKQDFLQHEVADGGAK